MKRRKTVSVTPAMGARTVAGEIVTVPIARVAGTGRRGMAWRTRVPAPHELSQNFFTSLFYFLCKFGAMWHNPLSPPMYTARICSANYAKFC